MSQQLAVEALVLLHQLLLFQPWQAFLSVFRFRCCRVGIALTRSVVSVRLAWSCAFLADVNLFKTIGDGTAFLHEVLVRDVGVVAFLDHGTL
jgi:hypothetical protein